MSYRGDEFPDRVKYWLKPEIESLIKDSHIECHFKTKPIEITPTHVTLQNIDGGALFFVPADFVLLMVGYEADLSLFRMLGVQLENTQQAPIFNPQTMETNVPGIFVAGTATAGTQSRFRVYLETCHDHAGRIVAALTGKTPPRASTAYSLPES